MFLLGSSSGELLSVPSQAEVNISRGPPLMHMSKHVQTYVPLEPDVTGPGGVLAALTVTAVRGQTGAGYISHNNRVAGEV